ncbi:MAG TPA: trehalose-phosphatase [Thermomicrobiales bacterium]|jgi:trehalose 6-phosphate phosphatase|nr:trehalose-phosphatase [Thermomicrobiales bacterium]
MTTPVPIETIAERAVAVLSRHPSGLFTDIDGTISRMAPHPDDATVEPEARAALASIAPHLDICGIVTGRALDVAMGLVQLDQLSYVGNHGLEWRLDGTHEDNPAALAGRDRLQKALTEIAEAAEQRELTEGLLLEDKRLSATVHYRQSPAPERFFEEMLPVLTMTAAANGLQLVPGRMIMELRPSTGITKGTALRDIVESRGLKGVVFSGDDISDVEGFAILRELRDAGTIDALIIGVVGPDTPVSVREHSDVQVADPGEMSSVLTAIANRLDRSTGGAA